MNSNEIDEKIKNAVIDELKSTYKNVLIDFNLGIDENTRSWKSKLVTTETQPMDEDVKMIDPETFEIKQITKTGDQYPIRSYIVRGNVIDDDTFSLRQIVCGGLMWNY